MRGRSYIEVLAVVLATSCGHRDSTSSSAASPSGSASTSDALETFGTAAPVVKLVAPGADPKRALVYAPRAATRSPKLTFSISTPGAPPAEQTGATLTLDWRSAAAASQFSVTKADGTIPPDAKGGERDTIAAIYGVYTQITGRVDFDRTGIHLARTAGMATQPSVLWLLHAIVVPLPADAVGTGARWQVTQRLSRDGMDGDLDRTYELVDLEDDRLTLHVTGGTQWKPGAAAGSNSGLPDHVEEPIEGTITIAPTDLLPLSADVTMHVKATLTIPDTPPAQMDSVVHVQLAP